MKVLNFTILLGVLMTMVSCGGSTTDQPANAEGFGAIEEQMKSEFGADAYYTDLTITYNESIGNIITTKVTKDPESLTMGDWNMTQGVWKQVSEISLEVPEGSKAADFMFQLGDKISLATLGGLIEDAKKELEAEKGIENPAFHTAFIKFPDNGDNASAEYIVMLKPEHGGTTFTFFYNLAGELTSVDY